MNRLLGIFLLVAAGDLSAQSIPEPLVFDLVLALGVEQGQVEANSIFFVPYERGTVSWTPEVEGAPFDNLGLDLELPFAGERLTGFNLGAQYTLGDAFGGRFIHAVQGRFERDDREGPRGALHSRTADQLHLERSLHARGVPTGDPVTL